VLTFLRNRRAWREEMRIAAEQMHALHGGSAYGPARMRVIAAMRDGDAPAARKWNAIRSELRRITGKTTRFGYGEE
jgi:hypothetical protein